MKFNRKLIFLFILVSFFMLTSCRSKQSELTKEQKEIYKLARDSGYEGSYEEWLDSIKGEAGKPGKDGMNIRLEVRDGFIKWQFISADNPNWNDLISLSSLMGKDGLNGKDIELNISDTHLQWRYVGDTNYKDLISLSVITGDKGRGIKGANINPLGELIITYTDETEENLGKILKSYLVQFVDYIYEPLPII